jgi:hypothetical protein
MVVGFTTIYAIGAYHHWCCGFDSHSRRGVQHYVIKFVSDLRQVSGFLRVLRFLSPIKLTAMIQLKYCWKWHQTPYKQTKPELHFFHIYIYISVIIYIPCQLNTMSIIKIPIQFVNISQQYNVHVAFIKIIFWDSGTCMK